MKILHLTLKKKWFDMIASGEKKEEYREIKSYWSVRLAGYYDEKVTVSFFNNRQNPFEKFDAIIFKNGYSKNARKMVVECKGISIGKCKIGWSDPCLEDVFVIKLGKIISK